MFKVDAMIKQIFIILLVCVASSAFGNTTTHSKDARIKIVSFQENNVIPIHGKIFTTTQIVFSEDECIQGVEGGDTTGWIVDYKPSMPNMIFIKPTVLDSNSNMTVVTNKHQYYFKVRSNQTLDSTEPVTYALKFIYPIEARKRLNEKLKMDATARAAILNKESKTYNWNYRFHGNKRIMPLHVFDDGTFTYFELRKNQEAPAIFAVDDKQGKESLVNTRREGNYLVVQRLAPQFSLRSGQRVASVFNSNEIARIRQEARYG